MQNGNGVNGAGAPQTVQVNPLQAAAFALQFLPRAPHTHAEREAFDIATMFLQAIAGGQVTVGPPLQAAPPAPVEARTTPDPA